LRLKASADCGRLDALLSDPGFFFYAAPRSLIAVFRLLQDEEPRKLARAYELVAHLLQRELPADRASYLELAALQLGLSRVADNWNGSRPRSSWRPQWVAWAAVTPHRVVALHPGLGSMVVGRHDGRVIIATGGGGPFPIHFWDAETGELTIRSRPPMQPPSVPRALCWTKLDDSPLIVAGGEDGRVWAVRPSGAIVWTTEAVLDSGHITFEYAVDSDDPKPGESIVEARPTPVAAIVIGKWAPLCASVRKRNSRAGLCDPSAASEQRAIRLARSWNRTARSGFRPGNRSGIFARGDFFHVPRDRLFWRESDLGERYTGPCRVVAESLFARYSVANSARREGEPRSSNGDCHFGKGRRAGGCRGNGKREGMDLESQDRRDSCGSVRCGQRVLDRACDGDSCGGRRRRERHGDGRLDGTICRQRRSSLPSRSRRKYHGHLYAGRFRIGCRMPVRSCPVETGVSPNIGAPPKDAPPAHSRCERRWSELFSPGCSALITSRLPGWKN
jgi:hypothetical protein